MSLPNCCSVVRKRFSLHSCRAPQAGGSCWLESEAVDDMAGPLLKPLGVDGAPFRDVGEWLLPFSTTHRQDGDNTTVRGQRFDRIPTKSGQAKKKKITFCTVFMGNNVHNCDMHAINNVCSLQLCMYVHVFLRACMCAPGAPAASAVSQVLPFDPASTHHLLPLYQCIPPQPLGHHYKRNLLKRFQK